MARKGPSSTSGKSRTATPQPPSDVEKRVAYFLDYISRINRRTLIAILQLNEAPDCQIDEVPGLSRFVYTSQETKFMASGHVTEAQATVLKKAAAESFDALHDQTRKLAKGLSGPVCSAQRSLVAALEPASDMLRAVESVPQPTGCCFFKDGSVEPFTSQSYCLGLPNVDKWVQGACPQVS